MWNGTLQIVNAPFTENSRIEFIIKISMMPGSASTEFVSPLDFAAVITIQEN